MILSTNDNKWAVDLGVVDAIIDRPEDGQVQFYFADKSSKVDIDRLPKNYRDIIAQTNLFVSINGRFLMNALSYYCHYHVSGDNAQPHRFEVMIAGNKGTTVFMATNFDDPEAFMAQVNEIKYGIKPKKDTPDIKPSTMRAAKPKGMA